jgi:putative ABC transport system permease protein
VEGDDASCLNLNRISQPAILGVEPEMLHDRFTFATKMKEIGETDLWLALNQQFEDGTIPAIADQTVIQWGLGMKVGDILLYQNEIGRHAPLKTDCRNYSFNFPGICYHLERKLSEKLSHTQRDFGVSD